MRISSNPWSHIRVFHGLHNSASALPCLYGFDGLRLRAFARKHASISPLPCFGRKAPPCIVGFVGAPTMTQPLITAEQHAQLLAVGEARATGQSIDPMPVVRLFTPDAHATWLLAALDPTDGDTAYGLIDLDRDARLGNGEVVRSGCHRRAVQAARDARQLLSTCAATIGIRAAGAGKRLDHGLMQASAAGSNGRIVTISVLPKTGQV